MLNELLVAQRGLAAAGVSMVSRHPDIRDVRKGLPTLLVRLDGDGRVDSVRPVPADARPWTLGDGNHNRFPFVQPKTPFWNPAVDHEARDVLGGRDAAARRKVIFQLADEATASEDAAKSLIGPKFEARLEARGEVLSVDDGNMLAKRVAEGMRRFLLAAGSSADHAAFANQLASALIATMRDLPDDLLTDIAHGLLVGKIKDGSVVSAAGLLIDATPDETGGATEPVWHPAVAIAVSKAMEGKPDDISDTAGETDLLCALTGRGGPLLSGSFPNPNLPTLGPTLLYSRNGSTPSLGRYGQFDDAIQIDQQVAETLAAAAGALTEPHREGKTWRPIPGERPKQTDLLLAYVAAAPDAPVAEIVTTESDLEHLTEELITSLKGRGIEKGLSQTPVRLAIFRRVDPGNRKAIASDTISVGTLIDAANDWRAARRLIPSHLKLAVPEKGKKFIEQMPPNVAPMSLMKFTQPIYLRDGTDRRVAVGVTASEALRVFLSIGAESRRDAKSVLQMVLRRRSTLVAGCAHARRRGLDALKSFDRLEVLRTVTVLCTLLHKLGSHQDTTMTESPAYRLGQLLASADVVHAGYCADVRGGQLPPSLLGNQVFAAAQKSPIRALEMLGRRWKPYGAWAGPRNEAWERADRFVASKSKKDQQRGWSIRVALRHARDWKPLAEALAPALSGMNPTDAYRAELLLGYLAGLPKPKRDDDDDTTDPDEQD
jgi:hypothetical protein